MASVKRLSLLILIASALFLSGEGSVSARSPKSITINHNAQAQNNLKINNRYPPQVPNSAFESMVIEALRAIANEREASRKEDQANEKRWWPPSANWAIVYVTIGYAFIALFQLRSIRRQANIASSTLILANRPRIKVRTFVIKPRNNFVWNDPINVECQVVNCGGVEAYIVESNCTIKPIGGMPEGLPMLPPYSDQTDSFKVKDGILPAGLACPLFQPSDAMLMSRHDELVRKGDIKLYVFGYIFYRDKLCNFYRTAFCRQFDFQKNRFEIVDNPDYEHQD